MRSYTVSILFVMSLGIGFAAGALAPPPARADVLPAPVSTSGPDPAPVKNCSWTVVGAASNCDGLDLTQLYTSSAWPTACTATNDMVHRTVASATLADGIYLKITYAAGTDAGCRSVAASVYVPHYSGSKPCVVTLTRTSDGSTVTSALVHSGGFWSAQTASLYDKAVGSYASVSCSYGGRAYTGKTGTW